MEKNSGIRSRRRQSVEITLAAIGITTTAIAGLFLLGSQKNQYQATEKTPTKITDTYLKSLASLTENMGIDDSCSIDTPSYGKFEPAPLVQETSSSAMETSIYNTYGIAVDFVKSPVDASRYYTAEPFTNLDEADKIADLNLLQEGLSNFDPRVIRSIKLGNIAFAQDLVGSSSAELEKAGGLYLDPSYPVSEIFVVPAQGNAEYTEHVVVHELGHAIDEELLCDPTDDSDDVAISRFTTIPYGDTTSQMFVTPGPHQEFATQYAQTSVREDRAETLADTIVDRGIILPGDLEWNSPFQKKQMEIVRRLEQLSPGFTKYLINKTLKMKPSTAYNR